MKHLVITVITVLRNPRRIVYNNQPTNKVHVSNGYRNEIMITMKIIKDADGIDFILFLVAAYGQWSSNYNLRCKGDVIALVRALVIA